MIEDVKKLLKIGGLVIFFIFIIGYGFYRSYYLVSGIKITNVAINSTPLVSGITVEDRVVTITGNAKNAISLQLNGREISIDQEGNFTESVALLGGYNLLTIKALDKFGSEDEVNYQLMH